MKQHRFFVDTNLEKGEDITLTDHGTFHQMKDVLRLRKGDSVVLLDGQGLEFHGVIKKFLPKEVIVSKQELKKVSKTQKVELHLFASLIKKDKFEWVLQKATELGVTRITPIVSDRTEKLKLNMDRADKIVREASEQSERADVPFVDEPVSLAEALSLCETSATVLHLEGDPINVTQLRETGKVSLFVGPEGGWSEKDLNQFTHTSHEIVSMGDQVLRAETASIAGCSLLLLG